MSPVSALDASRKLYCASSTSNCFFRDSKYSSVSEELEDFALSAELFEELFEELFDELPEPDFDEDDPLEDFDEPEELDFDVLDSLDLELEVFAVVELSTGIVLFPALIACPSFLSLDSVPDFNPPDLSPDA